MPEEGGEGGSDVVNGSLEAGWGITVEDQDELTSWSTPSLSIPLQAECN